MALLAERFKFKIAQREKNLIILAAVVVFFALLLQFAVLPFLDSRERLQRGVVAKKEALAEIIQMSGEYHVLNRNSRGVGDWLAKRQKDFTLFSFLEKAAGDANVKKFIKYMKPSASSTGKGSFQESLVEMKLEGIALGQLTEYLHRIESTADVVSIKRISIQEEGKEAGLLDAILQVQTYAL